MCHKTKAIPNRVYSATANEFSAKRGLLYPIYADTIVQDIFKDYDYNLDFSNVVKNTLDLLHNSENCTNKCIGYFAALPIENSENKYMVAMSFCVPGDFKVFSRKYSKFLAMRKALSDNGILCHVTRVKKNETGEKVTVLNKSQVIASSSYPVYYFSYGHTISDQYKRFTDKCDKYYK